VSHHSTGAARLAGGPIHVADHPAEVAQLDHAVVHSVDVPDVAAVLDGLDLRVTTMGRTHAEDPLFFSAAGAAAAVAVELLGDT
jgi:hypothetical protein